MATPTEVALATRMRDAILRLLQASGTTREVDPDAWACMNEATAWLANPNIDADGRTPVYGYAVSGVHYMVDNQRGIWRYDTVSKRFVPLP